MKIIETTITNEELKRMAAATFGNMVKAVVDVGKGLLAVDAELHSDLEALLLENGSGQKDLWGVNLYPDMPGDEFVEYDSLINIRPSAANKSRNVECEGVRKKIASIVARRVAR
jgi:hypothetical protein